MDLKSSWAMKGTRPTINKQFVREYVYIYSSFSPLDGKMDSLILPYMDADNMQRYLDCISNRYPNEYLLIFMDKAPCHSEGALKIPENVQIEFIPPYSPELNPAENMWDEIKEKFFHNKFFNSINDLMDHMVIAIQKYESSPDIVKRITGWDWIVHNL